jgi:hypothetical protein
MDMSLDMSPKILRNMRGTMPHMTWNLLAIVHALRMWRHCLMGKKFELRIDHIGLKYSFEQLTLNAMKKI